MLKKQETNSIWNGLDNMAEPLKFITYTADWKTGNPNLTPFHDTAISGIEARFQGYQMKYS